MQKIPHGNGLLTFCPGTFNDISRILYIQMNGRQPIKDDSDNKDFTAFSAKCGKTYTEQRGHLLGR